MQQLARRGFLGGLLAVFAAPAIVRADSLMRVRGVILPPEEPIVTGWSRHEWTAERIIQVSFRIIGPDGGEIEPTVEAIQTRILRASKHEGDGSRIEWRTEQVAAS